MKTNIKDKKNRERTFEGKIRYCSVYDDEIIKIKTTDKISAFDKVLPIEIKNKGKILNDITYFFAYFLKDICPIWVIFKMEPNITVGHYCKSIPIEIIVRRYLCGSIWREYQKGKRNFCGNILPDNLKENSYFEEPIITHTTKGKKDKDISEKKILKKNIVSLKNWDKIKKYSIALFKKGESIVKRKGLILADTKYEFGIDNKGVLTLIDEIHTPDSSRYFDKNKNHLSKEILRKYLLSKGFSGKKNETMPEIDDSIIKEISNAYLKVRNCFIKMDRIVYNENKSRE